MPWIALLFVLAGCGPGQPAYLDRVNPVADTRAPANFLELTALLTKPGDRDPDDLMRTFKAFLDDTPVPLLHDAFETFFYYDFSHKLDRVYLEASFAPGRLEPLHRVGASALFTRTYEVPRPDRVNYRYSDGTKPLPDAFNPGVTSGDGWWHADLDPAEPQVQWVVGASEPQLGGQDLRLLLPPGYFRNLGQRYPLVVVVGESDGWTTALADAERAGTLRPMLVVSVETPGAAWTSSSLKAVVEDQVLPWLKERYRVSAAPQDLTLAGLGAAGKPAQDVATRSEVWPRVTTVLDVPYLKTLFPVVNP